MERILLSVEPADGAWQVVSDHTVLAREPRKQSAIELARRYARNRHEVTGEPTGVVAPICNGEWVVLERCGG